ncbi:MAG: TlpA disulfide reductase family protein [Bacteroidales bacterium]|nr:TlpA disulfide reductase family protein [Bacteroidales bacterium]
MIKALLINILLLTSLINCAQHSFTGVIDEYPYRELNICEQFGEESKIISTIRTGANGNFIFQFTDENKGLYRIYLENQNYFDIIYNNEDVHIRTKPENPQYNLEVLKSDENIQLYSYLIENYIYDYKIDVLTQLLEIYPTGKFYVKIEKELKQEKQHKNKNIEKVIKSNPTSFAGRYLNNFKVLTAPRKLNDYEKNEYLKKNYFDFYSIDDIDLLNSDAYTNLVLNYFKLYKSNKKDVYYHAAKTILDEIFFGEPIIFNYVFEYILSGLESLSLNESAYKLSVEYGDLCSDNNDNLKLRINNNTKLAIGKTAPDILSQTLKDGNYTLSKMKSDYTLLVFWSTECSHCQVLLPRLAAAQSVFNEANIDIVAISLDSNKDKLDNYLNKNQLPWKIICQCEGWNGSIAVDYAIFASPWMIIIDNKMKIVAKPYNEEKLYDFLEKIITNK